ncbi:MAG: helix-turn-helix transcriptional regulator [Sphingobacteriales bacterium]|nr:helix-turn-helix transcriptional regulator [Sphingobacteriales bacterium]
MKIQLNSVPGGPIALKEGLPAGYSGRQIPQSHIFSSTDYPGTIVIQKLIAAGFTIRYNIFSFLRKVILQGNCAEPGLYVRAMLKGWNCYRLKGLGKVRLKEKHFAAIYAEQGQCLSYYDKNREYEILELHFSRQMMLPFLELFPAIEKLVADTNNSGPYLYLPDAVASQELLDKMDRLLSLTYIGKTAKLHLDETIDGILTLILRQLCNQPEPAFKFSDTDLQSLHRAKEIIERNFKNHVSIRKLAKQVNLNEFKLKYGFRHFFKMSIFDCLLLVRMKIARDLLLQTDQPVKNISLDVGYRRLPSFVTAFRKCYGQSPGRLRKQNK